MRGCRPLSNEEIACLLDALRRARDRALFPLGIRTGFRISELLSLRVADVWQGGRIVDRIWVAGKHMKKKQEGRAVVLHLQAKQALSAWIAERGTSDPDGPLFASRQGCGSVSRRQALHLLHQAYERCGLGGKHRKAQKGQA